MANAKQSKYSRGNGRKKMEVGKTSFRASASRENTTRGIEEFCSGCKGLTAIVFVTMANRWRNSQGLRTKQAQVDTK